MTNLSDNFKEIYTTKSRSHFENWFWDNIDYDNNKVYLVTINSIKDEETYMEFLQKTEKWIDETKLKGIVTGIYEHNNETYTLKLVLISAGNGVINCPINNEFPYVIDYIIESPMTVEMEDRQQIELRRICYQMIDVTKESLIYKNVM